MEKPDLAVFISYRQDDNPGALVDMIEEQLRKHAAKFFEMFIGYGR